MIDGVQSVDNLKSGSHNQPLGADHPLAGLELQGNTIMADAWLRLEKGHSWLEGKCISSGLVHNTVVLDGDVVFYSGLDDDGDGLSWRQHDYEGPDPYGHWASDGCPMMSREDREMVEMFLYDVWGVKEGYEVWMDVQYPADWYWQLLKLYSLYGPGRTW
ncbi:hypothetical protein Spith_2067 [Spirochaeta thermophila DSM 6578]|uniref:Uncharacterized protein n=1 Tax=Winmispira thermophila (strain ATCC 700085 / DSM 6578 / Z-1203) TaxID=869211 RepID=G0GEX9_WINT7|nr:hypothetical protein [Spirochaeta thermophila]AEJ62323.1 hypothetical protein Spith_2067 [Spirochaeta thermophila DSM 6578]